jgi:hypothetical protein
VWVERSPLISPDKKTKSSSRGSELRPEEDETPEVEEEVCEERGYLHTMRSHYTGKFKAGIYNHFVGN